MRAPASKAARHTALEYWAGLSKISRRNSVAVEFLANNYEPHHNVGVKGRPTAEEYPLTAPDPAADQGEDSPIADLYRSTDTIVTRLWVAIDQVAKLVEVILADHRDQMRDSESLQHLLDLLDIFAETGRSEALRLVWQLDEVFR